MVYLTGISLSIRDQELEDKVHIFRKIDININECDLQVCHKLREKDKTILKVVTRKDCTNIFSIKKNLKHHDPSKLSFPEELKYSSSKVHYRGTWNKCKKLRANQRLHRFYAILCNCPG